MDTQALIETYKKGIKAPGNTGCSQLTVNASQQTKFAAWSIRLTVQSTSAGEWHQAVISWHHHDLITVGANNHTQLMRILQDHMKRLDGLTDMLTFVKSLDSNSVIDPDPAYKPE